MNTKRFFGVLFLSGLICFASASLSYSKDVPSTPAAPSDPKDFYKNLDLFTDVLAIVQKSYVDEVDSKDLIYGSLKGMLGSLDPHSQFMDPDMYKEMKVETEGEFGGLGIEITIKDKWLTVVTPMDGTPAFEAGLHPGDRIIKIDGESTEEITLLEAVKKLRGKPGSKVKLLIMRKGEGEFLDIEVTRDIIKIESVKDEKILEGTTIGYIRLTQFQEHSSDDLVNALNDLDKQGMKALILDLRNNPGGLLSEAIDVAEIFLGEQLIVSQKGRLPEQNAEYKGNNGTKFLNMPLVVMINGGSASGSEIVAGAVQDYARGILVGTKSFGKGSVQSVLPMKDGSALRLTTAKYFTPKGRSVHGEGIQPDIVVEVSEADQMKLIRQKRQEKLKEVDGETQEKDAKKKEPIKTEKEKVKPDKDKKEKDEKEGEEEAIIPDLQLDRSIDLLKGLHILMEKSLGNPWAVKPQVKIEELKEAPALKK